MISYSAAIASFDPDQPLSLADLVSYSMGSWFLLFPIVAVACLILSVFLALRGKGPFAGAALVLVIHIPLMLALFIAVQTGIAGYRVQATSPSNVSMNESAMLCMTMLMPIFVGLMLIAPSYLVAGSIVVVKSLRRDRAVIAAQAT